MKLVRTIKLKLKEDPKVFQPTIDAYTKAFNHTCQVGWNDKTHNGVQLHHKVYEETRKYLPSQLAVSARMKATEALKSVKARLKKRKKASCPQSKQIGIRYDARSFNVWWDRNEISFSTVEGRKKVQIEVPEYFKQYLTWKRCSADLFIRKGQVFLNIVVEKEIEDPISNGSFVGVDRGIKKLAVTSDLRFFGGGHVKQVSRRYKRLRSVLQSKGHSGKRHLKKISSKENRFRRDVNHVVSKQIVQGLKPGTTLVLEKLTGLTSKQVPKMRRKKTKDRERRREHSSWSYYQLEEFLKYKAASQGVLIDYVSACYTSRGCSKCGHIARSNRTCQSRFSCRKCGYQVNADLNASFNIVKNYLDAKGYPDRAFQGALCSSHSCVA
jgi:IS605 OrfB family transposase